MRQRRLKALVAYSSIAQIGYLFLLFPLSTPGALAGGIYLAVTHATAKASMFIAAGVIHRVVGHDDLDRIHGVAHHIPVSFMSLALAGVSLMGMPPSGGFVAKWLLVRAAIERGAWGLACVILLGGLLAAGYVFKVLRTAFLPGSAETQYRAAPRGEQLVALVLALIALLLGIAPDVSLDLLKPRSSS